MWQILVKFRSVSSESSWRKKVRKKEDTTGTKPNADADYTSGDLNMYYTIMCVIRRLSRLIRNVCRTRRGKTSTCCQHHAVLLRTVSTRHASLLCPSSRSQQRAVCNLTDYYCKCSSCWLRCRCISLRHRGLWHTNTY